MGNVIPIQTPAWEAMGVIEAPLEHVVEVLLNVAAGPVGDDNAPLLAAVPGAGRMLNRATLSGGPDLFTVHYGMNAGGGKVTVDRVNNRFTFSGGYKFRATYEFAEHWRGTVMIYQAYNIAPDAHQNRAAVRFQFWLGGRLKIGLRGALRRASRLLNCPTHVHVI